ncbi:GerAB/ArcD/ProY family transporter [Ectobacillus funiculus]|uniref:Endospore germination permease n=1 Tax=Ectobacillus funiculus TaxID=137993 RepID=A0ABV5WI88_9BACI
MKLYVTSVMYSFDQLHQLYPNKTLIQYSDQILGRFIGKIISLIYLFYLIKSIGLISRQYGEFIAGVSLLHTPRVMIIGSMIFVSAIAVRLGIEVIARAAQIFVPLIVVGWIVMIVLLIPDMEINSMFPMMENGITPIIKGSIHFDWFLHFSLLTFLLPMISDQKNTVKLGFISVIAIMLTFTAIDLTTLFILGEITDSQTYPVMSAAQYIEVGDFLEHLEAIIMAIWVAGAFIKISFYYYIFVLGTIRWLELSDYRPIVFPLNILFVSFSFWLGPTMVHISQSLNTSNLLFNYVARLGLPLLLLMLAYIRKSLKQYKQ